MLDPKTIDMNFPGFDGMNSWYGIEGIKFIWINTQSDPLIEYKGKTCSCYIVEDTMWERYREDCELDGVKATEKGFEEYMQNNSNDVFELCELALFGKEI